MRRSSVLLLLAACLLGGGAGAASAGCMEEIPGICVHDVRDDCPARPACGG